MLGVNATGVSNPCQIYNWICQNVRRTLPESKKYIRTFKTLFYKIATWDTVPPSNNLQRSDDRCRGSAYWERPKMKNVTAHCPAAQTDDERKKLLSSNFALAFQIRFKWHSALVTDSKHLLVILCPFISVTYVSPESEKEWRDEFGGLN